MVTVGNDLAVSSPRDYVLRVEAVRGAIRDLRSRRVYDFFPAYLHLRAQSAVAGSTTSVLPRWREFADAYLAVPGDPSGRPYFRPFREGDTTEAYWLNSNVAGSWAPSSLRDTNAGLKVIRINGRAFDLRENHEALALEHLLMGVPLPAVSVAAYLYRDYSFNATVEPTGSDLVNVFRDDFGFPSDSIGDAAFDTLFTTQTTPELDPPFEEWFGSTTDTHMEAEVS